MMSCSRFIDHEDDKSDTLVIIVNGDGTATVDPHTLEKVLTNKCRAAVSIVRIDDTDEPDSSAMAAETSETRGQRKVNLVLEGYFPPPDTDATHVTSTVHTPPSESSRFTDLVSEEMETSVPPVADTLKINDDEDDWVNFDHCYSSKIFSREKQSEVILKPVPQVQSPTAVPEEEVKSTIEESSIIQVTVEEPAEKEALENEIVNEIEAIKDEIETDDEEKVIKKGITNRMKLSKRRGFVGKLNKNVNVSKGKTVVPISPKIKRRQSTKLEENALKKKVEVPPQRNVTEDEVDGVKVFKPSKADRQFLKPFGHKGLVNVLENRAVQKIQLVQTKLQFNKIEGPVVNDITSSKDVCEKDFVGSDKRSTCMSSEGATKQDSPVQQEPDTPEADSTEKPVSKKTKPIPSPEFFGPALFSTPDIIRKVHVDDTPVSSKVLEEVSPIAADNAIDIERQISALENGHTLKKEDDFSNEASRKNSVRSYDEKLLSDLESSADEGSRSDENVLHDTSVVSSTREEDSVNPNSSVNESDRKISSNSDLNDDFEENEDDPNKLWCICNKPHNNRFMICCDACDNWFHGYCVGISKSMGEKMEQNGTEWLCPNCKKEKFAKVRESKTKSFRHPGRGGKHQQPPETSPNTSNIDNSSSKMVDPKSTPHRVPSTHKFVPDRQLCVNCELAESAPNSCYCGVKCVNEYVDKSVARMNAENGVPLAEDTKIIVFDRKTSRLITGLRAPSVSELKQWIIAHPSFIVIRPSGLSMSKLEAHAKPLLKRSSDDSLMTADRKIARESDVKKVVRMTEHVKQPTKRPAETHAIPTIKKQETRTSTVVIREGNVIRMIRKEIPTNKPRQIKLLSQLPPTKPMEEPKMTKIKEQATPPAGPSSPIFERNKILGKMITPDKAKPPETVKPPERTKSMEKLKLPEKVKLQEKVKSLEKAKSMEKVKEKAKPPEKVKPSPKRSDAKRHDSTADESIVDSPVTPGPDSIRSSIRKSLSELFMSRLKEAADINLQEEEVISLATCIEEELHNLFKDTGAKYKSKYRSLLFNIKDQKNTLFRRIVERILSPYDLVRLTPEELASTELAQWREREAKHEIDMIKKTELENLNQAKVFVVKTHKGEQEIKSDVLASETEVVVPELQPNEALPGERKKPMLLFPNILPARNSGKHEDSGKHRRDKHRSRKHRKHSSERRRSKHSDSHSKSSRRRSTERHRTKSIDESRRDSDSKNSRKSEERTVSQSSNEADNQYTRESDEVMDTEPVEQQPMEVNPISLPEEQQSENVLLDNYLIKPDYNISDMEPTSTVTIKTPPYSEMPDYIWRGTMTMPDVARFTTVMKEVAGNYEGLDEELPDVIECVGRISPAIVWEYIAKVRKSGTRDIVVVRFEITEEQQRLNYLGLFSYLYSKSRFAVIESKSLNIKDFYVMPLGKNRPIPPGLLPLVGSLIEDFRSHLLLGILVRNRRQQRTERPLPMKTYSMPAEESYTPPHSPTSVFVKTIVPPLPPIIVDPLPKMEDTKDDENVPYSPQEDEPYSPTAPATDLETTLQRQMEEVERKIQEGRMQIACMEGYSLPQSEAYSPTDDSSMPQSDAYSPTDDAADLYPSVKLPESLQNFLHSICKKSDASINLNDDPIVTAYQRDGDYDEPTSPAEYKMEESPPASHITDSEVADEEPKVNRDPRCKVVADTFKVGGIEPPPPGMEEEYTPPPAVSVPPTTYSIPDTSFPPPMYAYPMAQPMPPPYMAPTMAMPQMYMPPAAVFPPPPAVPYPAMAPPLPYPMQPSLPPDPAPRSRKRSHSPPGTSKRHDKYDNRRSNRRPDQHYRYRNKKYGNKKHYWNDKYSGSR